MKFIIGVIVATTVWAGLLYFVPAPQEKIYDCSLAEFHPDYPIEVREACRKLRMQKRNNITV